MVGGVFGPTVIENSVLKGGHYNRCLDGMQLLAEAFEHLLFNEFFTDKCFRQYTPKLAILTSLKSAVEKKNIANGQKYMVEFGEA